MNSVFSIFHIFTCALSKTKSLKIVDLLLAAFVAHLSRRLIGKLIVYQCCGVRRRPSVIRPSSVRRRSKFQNIFFPESAWLIKAKFYEEPPWVGERNFVRGIWVTWPRWPQRPYMVKPLQKSSPELVDRFPQNLVCSIWDSSSS